MKYIFAITLASLVLAPATGFAYQVTSSSATKLNDTTYLYTISYQLGSVKYDIMAPIGTVRAGERGSPYVSYTFTQDEDEELIGGTSSAVVLSTAPVVGNRYQVKAGESQRFTLFALLSFDKAPELDESQLRVNRLPFTLQNNEVTLENGLSSGELQSYVTPKVE